MRCPRALHRTTGTTGITLTVAILLVLSGCSGFSPLVREYPLGVTGDGVQNATALATAHEHQLRQGYHAETVSRAVAENGTTLFQLKSRTHWSSTRANASVTRTLADPSGSI